MISNAITDFATQLAPKVLGVNPASNTPLSTQPQGALSMATQTEPKVNEMLYDPTLINESVQQPKFGGSFDNLFSTTPPLSQTTPQFNSIGDPLYGSDPAGFDPNNLGFVADQSLSPYGNFGGSSSPYRDSGGGESGYQEPANVDWGPLREPTNNLNSDNVLDWTIANPNATITPEIQTLLDEYWVKHPIDLPNLFEGMEWSWDRGFYSPKKDAEIAAKKAEAVGALSKQILGQGTTSQWSGQGHGSAEANAQDMARILDSIGITDIKQFGKIDKTVPLSSMGFTKQNGVWGTNYTDEDGNTSFNPIDQSQIVKKNGEEFYKTGETYFGNKVTGQAVPNTYSERQTGNAWGGTFAGKGNTGYRVQFDEQGNPYFYTTHASSSDLAKIAPILAIAQFVPGLAPFAMAANAAIAASQGNVLGAIAGAAGLGGYSDVANAANFAGAVKSGNPLSIISSGANLGGTDLSGVANAAGLGDISNIGGVDLKDATKAYQAVKAIQSGDPSAIISTIGGYIQDQNNQRPSSPLDSLVTTPSDSSSAPSGALSGYQEPVERPIETSPIDSSIGAPSEEIPSIGGNPIDTLPELPQLPEPPKAADQQKDLSEKSFKSAFAQARASGDKEFLWNGNVYNTNLAPSMNAGPASRRTIDTGAGMNPDIFAGWGGSKVDPNLMKTAAPYMGWDPTTYFPKVDIRMADPTSALGNVPESGYKSNQQTYLNMAPYVTGMESRSPGTTADVLSHELAHVGQVLTSKPGEDISKQYLRMANEAGMSISDRFNKPSDITNFDKTLNESIDYINQKYGTNAGTYLGNPKAPLFEKLTDLAAIEMQTGKDLTQDPVLKETLFKDPKAVAMYNAMTIPRMSRLDPRDLPPGRVTTSDFPKGQVPLEFRLKNLIRGK